MRTVLDKLVDDIVDAVFFKQPQADDCNALRAARRLASVLADPKTSRRAQVRAIADTILAVEARLSEQSLTARAAANVAAPPETTATVPADPPRQEFKPRRYRVLDIIDIEEPADVTAAVFGDPAPGRSALDMKETHHDR